MNYKECLGIVLSIVGFVMIVYVSFYLMLYCGIMNLSVLWGVEGMNSVVVSNLFRVVLFELGAIPGVIVSYFGLRLAGVKA